MRIVVTPKACGRFPVSSLKWPATLVFLGLTFTEARSQTIAYAGSDLGIGSGWRDPTVTKPMDIDHDNVFGSAGYVMYGTSNVGAGGNPGGTDLVSLPSFASVVTTAKRFSGPYSVIDQPTPSGFSGLMQSGIAYQSPSGSGPQVFVTITITRPVTRTLQIGYYNGGLDYGTVPSKVTLASSNGVSASFSPTIPVDRDRNDFYFWDVSGLKMGDQLTLSITANDNPDPNIRNRNPSIGGVTFDLAPVPEPSTVACLGLGVVMVLGRRRATKN